MRLKICALALATMGLQPLLAGETVDVDVGNGMVVKLAKDRPLRIAFFSEGTNNSAMTASIEGAKEAAAKHGWTIDVFDGSFEGKPVTKGTLVQFIDASNLEDYQPEAD